jgi:hypothetical protein
MVDTALMRGEGWVRCSICGELHEAPYPGLAVDVNGDTWDLCSGPCARDAGVVEVAPIHGPPAPYDLGPEQALDLGPPPVKDSGDLF